MQIEASGGVEFDLDGRTMVGREVRIQYGDVELCCLQLNARVSKDGKLSVLRCSGGVALFRAGAPVGRARTAELDMELKVLKLHGDAIVHPPEQQGRLSAQRVVYDMKRRRLEARGRARWTPDRTPLELERCGAR